MPRSRHGFRAPALPAAALGLVAALVFAAAPAAAASRPSLDAAFLVVDRTLTFAGVAYGVDARANQLVVTVDSSVSGGRLASVRAVVQRLGSMARLEFIAGNFTLAGITGGDSLYG